MMPVHAMTFAKRSNGFGPKLVVNADNQSLYQKKDIKTVFSQAFAYGQAQAASHLDAIPSEFPDGSKQRWEILGMRIGCFMIKKDGKEGQAGTMCGGVKKALEFFVSDPNKDAAKVLFALLQKSTLPARLRQATMSIEDKEHVMSELTLMLALESGCDEDTKSLMKGCVDLIKESLPKNE